MQYIIVTYDTKWHTIISYDTILYHMIRYIFISYHKIWYWIASYHETVFNQTILLIFFNIIHCFIWYDIIWQNSITHLSYKTRTVMQYVSRSSTLSKDPFILHISRFILDKYVWMRYGLYLLQYVRLKYTLWCFKTNLPKHLDYLDNQDHTPYLKLALYFTYIVKSTMPCWIN